MRRKRTREVLVGGVKIGNNNPVAVQSMTNTDTRDIKATIEQVKRLEQAGCEIVRVAVMDMEAAEALKRIKAQTSIPLVADIHFDYRLALAALENGVDKLRINPGNIGSREKTKRVVEEAKQRGVPIRIGVNSGSLAKWAEEKYGRTPTAMVESALEHVHILESLNFFNTIISLKATDVQQTILAYEMMSERTEYPLHLGITEAGTKWFGTIKSAAGIGALLLKGIGDTLRVSLTGDPVEEVKVAWALLAALDLRRRGPVFVSCPTCGRTQIPLEHIAIEVEEKLKDFPLPITIAVMGCPVNGPGEAKDADLGIAGGNGVGLVFRKGQVVKKVSEDKLVEALVEEAELLLKEV